MQQHLPKNGPGAYTGNAASPPPPDSHPKGPAPADLRHQVPPTVSLPHMRQPLSLEPLNLGQNLGQNLPHVNALNPHMSPAPGSQGYARYSYLHTPNTVHRPTQLSFFPQGKVPGIAYGPLVPGPVPAMQHPQGPVSASHMSQSHGVNMAAGHMGPHHGQGNMPQGAPGHLNSIQNMGNVSNVGSVANVGGLNLQYHDVHIPHVHQLQSDTLLNSLASQHSHGSASDKQSAAGANPNVKKEEAAGQSSKDSPVAAAAGPPETKQKLQNTRKRLSTACDKCRQKKIKCDNIRPRCGSCTRNGIPDCHYSSESAHLEIWLLDAAYNSLSSKIDMIMKELHARGENADLSELQLRPRKKRRAPEPIHGSVQQWDASFTCVIQWPYLQQQLGINPDETDRHIGRILSCCDKTSMPGGPLGSVELEAFADIEKIFHKSFSWHVNAYLTNSHTKVPLVDIVELIEQLEIFTLLKKAKSSIRLPQLLREFYMLKSTENVGKTYIDMLAKLELEDSKVLQNAYRNFCQSLPVIFMVCAIGVISAPVSLDNIGTYTNSLEELSSMGQNNDDTLPTDRYDFSRMYVKYASAIMAVFPFSAKPYSILSIKYHILLSQYHHYTLSPSLAHEAITTACNYLVFLIEKTKSRAQFQPPGLVDPDYDQALVNRLYWTCLKLECELRVEFSPHISLSPLARISPPSSFFGIPDPFDESEHTSDSINIANKYDDQNTWYYFLTEIAVRRIDNCMLDDIYSVSISWDDQKFLAEDVWKLTIKYLNQLNGIIKSLTPAIRKFVLMETDPAQIYASVKRKALRKRKAAEDEEKVIQVLDDYLINEDLLHHAQSESVMFIKTRIISSKMYLMRPLAYMYLHDHIQFEELMEAAMYVITHSQFSQSEREIMSYAEEHQLPNAEQSLGTASDGSIYSLADALNVLGQEDETFGFNFTLDNETFKKDLRFDDFSDLVEPAENEDDPDGVVIDYEAARKRILRWFVCGLISIPKLNIPKIGLFRHPGSWYYIRNLVMGVIVQFLIFQKTQSYFAQMANGSQTAQSNVEALKAINQIFKKEKIQVSLEHALLITDYWKEERKDCAVYSEYLRQCLNRL